MANVTILSLYVWCLVTFCPSYPYVKAASLFLGALRAQLVFHLPSVENYATHLHLSCQILVLVTDDRQSGLLTQSVGTVSESLLRSRRRRRTAYFFITKAPAPLV